MSFSTSPVVRGGSKAKPGYAAVHTQEACLSDNTGMLRAQSSPGLQGSYTVELGAEGLKVIRRRRQQLRSNSEIRTPLSKEDLEVQNAKAVQWFQNAQSLNQKRKTVDDMESTLAEMRRLRAERTESKNSSKGATEEGTKSLKPPFKRGATVGDGPVLPALTDSLKMSMLKGLKESTEEQVLKAPDGAPVSLMERFGYGVKQNPLQSSKFKIAATAVKAGLKFGKATQASEVSQYAAVGINAGETLLERLQKRKAEKTLVDKLDVSIGA